MDTDEKEMWHGPVDIRDLRERLQSLWPPHEPTKSEKDQVIAALTPIFETAFKHDWEPVESPSGTFVVQAPPACLLFVRVRSRDIEAGSRQCYDFVIRSTENPGRGVLELKRGASVHGTVRDAKTRKPIAGATVRPTGDDYSNSSFVDSEENAEQLVDRNGHYWLRAEVNARAGRLGVPPGLRRSSLPRGIERRSGVALRR